MFRLKATLVAMMPMRPWRTGWSVDRGVDFSLTPAPRPVEALSASRAAASPVEPASFIDEDWISPPRGSVVRSYASLAADEAAVESPPEEPPEATGLRAWWSLSGKPSRT